MRSITALLILLLAGAAAPASAQTTGKISGTVTDGTTGETLPGVNVFVEGTTLGTATDVNGRYAIIGVRPGTYTVMASSVGFATQRKTGVRVNVDLTTNVDFELREEVFEGEEVVVTAEAEGVRRDLTSSETRVTSESIDRLPVQEMGDILSQQAGITTSGSGIHIRGGRSKEVAFFVDGVRVSDAYDGSISVQIENDAIQELQVISGTYNAEYGQAMSGIINVVTKEGGPEYSGSIEAYSGSYLAAGDGADYLRGADVDGWTDPDDEFSYLGVDPYSYLDVDPMHYQNLRASISGPIFGKNVTFFTLGRYFKNDGWLQGARIYNIDGTPGDSSLVAMNPYEKLSGQFNLKWKVSQPITFNLTGLGSMAEGQNYGHAWRWNPDGRPTFHEQGYNLNLKMTHTLSARAFYTVNAATYYKHYESWTFEDIDDPRYNALLLTNPTRIPLASGDTLDVERGNRQFLPYGVDLGRFDRTSKTYLLKADLTTQLHENHMVKTGVEARLDQLELRGFSLTTPAGGGDSLIVPSPETSRLQQFNDVAPISLSAYLQDKIEFETFIVNAGLRFDYFDSRDRVPADRQDPNIFNPFKAVNIWFDEDGSGAIEEDERRANNRKTVEDREEYWWDEPSPKVQISPRLGIAYPITAEGVIHFSYGHFLQIPTFEFLFNNYGYKMPLTSGTYGPFGNADLEPQKTVMYEIGLQQGIGPVVVDATAFYRDVRNWVSTPAFPFETAQPGVNYVVYTNRDYSNVRGVTLAISKRFSDNYSFDLDYTYQVAEGSNSDPEQEFFSRQGGAPPTIALTPLNWDQRHTVNVSFFVGAADWGVSTLARAGSGYPYTPDFLRASVQGPNVIGNLPTNSRRKPVTTQVDMYLFKDFAIGAFTPRVFLQVYNLFDQRNANGVYSDTGLPDVTLDTPGQADPGWYIRPEFYSEPRRAHLGLELKF